MHAREETASVPARLSEPVWFAVDELVLTGTPRSAVDEERVRELAARPGPTTPILVHAATRLVVDGVHRVRAAQLRREERIPARLCRAAESDLFGLAVAANAEHGRPLPVADRKTAAARLLADHPDWSTRRVAAAVGLAPGTVARLRGPTSPAEVRIGRNGRRRAVDARRGREIAGTVLAAEPDVSLRTVARRAGISPSTVRDVRERLRHGGTAPAGPEPGATPVPAAVLAPASIPVRRILAQLRTDPSLRHTESGRRLLTGLAAGFLDEPEVDRLTRTLPSHCDELVAVTAEECARAWQDLADALRRRRHLPAEHSDAVRQRTATGS